MVSGKALKISNVYKMLISKEEGGNTVFERVPSQILTKNNI